MLQITINSLKFVFNVILPSEKQSHKTKIITLVYLYFVGVKCGELVKLNIAKK